MTQSNYYLDLADEELQVAIKASIQTAIQEGINILQPCNSFEGNFLLIEMEYIKVLG